MTIPAPSELTKEKNLFQVYRASRKLHSNCFNQLVVAISAIAFGVVWVASWYREIFERTVITNAVFTMSEFGFTFTVSMLGFLLAGFTVFATLGKTELLMQMAKYTYPKSELSYLKYTYFMFMRVMIMYFIVAVVCAGISLLGPFAGAFFSSDILAPHNNTVKWVILGTTFVMLGSSLFYLLAILQSFIFNIYHMVMTSIRWEFEKPKNE